MLGWTILAFQQTVLQADVLGMVREMVHDSRNQGIDNLHDF